MYQYQYDQLGILSPTVFTDVPGFGVQIPANGIELENELIIKAGYVWLYHDGKPLHIKDSRGIYYSIETGEQLEFKEIGEPPKNLTKKAPNSSFDKWDGKEWIKDERAEIEDLKQQAFNKKESLLSIASEKITPLQDAVDIDEATDDELAMLKEWKKYRVLLNRIENQHSYPQQIDWPQPPE